MYRHIKKEYIDKKCYGHGMGMVFFFISIFFFNPFCFIFNKWFSFSLYMYIQYECVYFRVTKSSNQSFN